MAASLGKVALTVGKEYVIGLLYREKTIVTYNGNTYCSLKDTAETPSDDGVNWKLWLEGVPIATTETAGKVKPDGDTITVDADGTIHGASQVPEGVTFVDLEAETEELPEKVKVNADQLGGQNPEYYATAENLDKVVSGETVVGKATDADTLDGYHASDLPYLPLTGGTLTGNAKINKANPIMDLLSTSTGRASRIQCTDASGSAGLVNYKDSSNYTAIWLSGEGSALSNMLRMVSIKDGVSNTYPILHTGNSKRFIEDTTAPSDTTAAWIDTANKVIKSYIDGAWTPVS